MAFDSHGNYYHADDPRREPEPKRKQVCPWCCSQDYQHLYESNGNIYGCSECLTSSFVSCPVCGADLDWNDQLYRTKSDITRNSKIIGCSHCLIKKEGEYV